MKQNKSLLYGLLWAGGGILATLITYLVANTNGGGTYFLFWGAILYGMIKIIRGLNESDEETLDEKRQRLIDITRTQRNYEPVGIMKVSDQYYVDFKGREYGPYSLDKMKSYLKQRKITEESIVKFGYDGQGKALNEFIEIL